MDGEVTDKQVVSSVLNGDLQSYEILVRRYHPALYRLAANRTGLQHEAEDIVQETFVAAFKSLHTYNSEYAFRTWLWTILLNQCRRHGSKASRRPAQLLAVTDEHQPLAAASPDLAPDLQMETGERDAMLRCLLNNLPETRADAVRLRFFGQLKFQEIADTLDCSLSASKKWVREGLLLLADQLRANNAEDNYK